MALRFGVMVPQGWRLDLQWIAGVAPLSWSERIGKLTGSAVHN
jgi:hypothetical protein